MLLSIILHQTKKKTLPRMFVDMHHYHFVKQTGISTYVGTTYPGSTTSG